MSFAVHRAWLANLFSSSPSHIGGNEKTPLADIETAKAKQRIGVPERDGISGSSRLFRARAIRIAHSL
jgi:hypothetical protein